MGLAGILAGYPWGYFLLPLGYNVRSISLAEISLFGVLSVGRFGWRSLIMFAFFDAVAELAFNSEYLVSCPSSIGTDVLVNPHWPVFALVWVAVVALTLLVVRPRFVLKSWTTALWLAFQGAFLLAGTPIILPYCHGPAVAHVWQNWPWEAAELVCDFLFLYGSFRPREKEGHGQAPDGRKHVINP